jgi:type II restriction enzyme
MRQEAINFIFQIAKEKDAFERLEKRVLKISRKTFTRGIIECGILPEMFDHDSSEEKLWAKFSDIILAKSLNYLGIESEVLGARGNSADVIGKTAVYSMVGDAKTFRLSRTAKNQKDFKVNALDSWRKKNNYALLVAPLSQYPPRSSQIYAQAIDKNVTLFSYTHLMFLLEFYNGQSLQAIWESGNKLKKYGEQSLFSNSAYYWKHLDENVCNAVNQTTTDLNKYKLMEVERTGEIGKEGIEYWQNKIKEFNGLSRKEAIDLLIKAEKIETKIKTIQKAIKIQLPV